MDVNFKVGDTFSSYEELKEKIKHYKTARHISLQTRDSRTTNNKRVVKSVNPALKYYELKYMCSLGGGRAFRSRGTGKRNVTSFKQGCEMYIRFGVSEDGSQLVVKSMSEDHNHEINEKAVVKEALHPELCTYITKIVWNDINIRLEEVKRRLENYVCDEMFKDQSPPPRTRRQYFPSKKQIRYFMAKAKASLNITEDVGIKLEAHAKKLREARRDEKMLFNFKMQSHDASLPSELEIDNEDNVVDTDSKFFTGNNNTPYEKEPIVIPLANEVHNANILFCHQTPHQQRLMRRYSSQLILTQISGIYSKIPFPLFCLYVPTNVDFQVVGEFISQSNTSSMITEGLQTFKGWNPGWNPKFVVVDFSEEQINAVESVFPATFVMFSDASREKAWSDWLNTEGSEPLEHKEEITAYLQAIGNSFSEDMLSTSARELEESLVWRMSDKLRSWFQNNWLSQAKRWVAGYRPDDYMMCSHHGRTLESELKVFESIKLVNKSAPLQDVIQHIVEHVAPVARKQYEILNKESVKLQKELKYMYSGIPNYLACRPGKVTHHIYERLKLVNEQNYTLTYLHPGIFSVQSCSVDDDILHSVSFGDSNNFPSCDCDDWQHFKLPCVHLCAVFNNYPGWTWDMLSVAYKSSPVLNVDWSFVSENLEDEPGCIIDKSTQTSDTTLISNSLQLSRMGKMTDSCVTETPQVLASQCRGLLQQLSKLQLAHHARDSLYRLRSELKKIISMFSNAPKQKMCSPITVTDTYVVQSKGPGRPCKIIPTHSQSEVVQPVFKQCNMTPTSRQVKNAGERKIYPSRKRAPSQLAISRPPEEATTIQQCDNNVVGTVYIVDPTRVLVNAKDKASVQNIISPNQLQYLKSITQNQLHSAMDMKLNESTARKRTQSPMVFLKPPDKRIKEKMVHAGRSYHDNVAPRFTRENVDDKRNVRIHNDSFHKKSLPDDTLLTVDSPTMSAVIDGQKNNPLKQVFVIMDKDVAESIESVDTVSIQRDTLEMTNTIERPSTCVVSIEPAQTSIDMPIVETNTLAEITEEKEVVSKKDLQKMCSDKTVETSQTKNGT